MSDQRLRELERRAASEPTEENLAALKAASARAPFCEGGKHVGPWTPVPGKLLAPGSLWMPEWRAEPTEEWCAHCGGVRPRVQLRMPWRVLVPATLHPRSAQLLIRDVTS